MAMKRISLVALTKEQLVELLVKVGSSTFTRDTLESDISKGALVNDDGTINLIHYATWLIRENDE
jgi:hypothetical protein